MEIKRRNDILLKRESKDNAKHRSLSASFKQNQKKKSNPDALDQS